MIILSRPMTVTRVPTGSSSAPSASAFQSSPPTATRPYPPASIVWLTIPLRPISASAFVLQLPPSRFRYLNVIGRTINMLIPETTIKTDNWTYIPKKSDAKRAASAPTAKHAMKKPVVNSSIIRQSTATTAHICQRLPLIYSIIPFMIMLSVCKSSNNYRNTQESVEIILREECILRRAFGVFVEGGVWSEEGE